MSRNINIYILIMAAVTFAIRVVPLTIFQKQIKNRFFQSFLYYVPYVTLAVMTFPAITKATGNMILGYAALAVGIVAAWFGASLFKVAVSCCAVVLILGFII